MNETLTPLKDGQMDIQATPFLASQQTGADKGFKNVSSIWLAKTLTFDKGMELLTKGKAETEDLFLPMESVKFEEDKASLVVNLDGNKVRPTEHALRQLSTRLDIPSKILTNWHSGDSQDIQTVIKILENGKRKLSDDEAKENWLYRTRKDGTLRATLSCKYARLDSLWFLESLKTIIPGGLLSHWDRCDAADTIYGNILIPDFIRKEKDSDYGGGVSVSNSEIGTRCLGSHPWLFRFICMNGCIWDKIKGVSYTRKHLGTKINYEEQFAKLKENIEKQIPLVPTNIDNMLNTRTMKWAGTAKRMLAQVTIDTILTKKQGATLLESYEVEPELSCFGLINAITRASQKMPNDTWVALDSYASALTDATVWSTYCAKARALTEKDVESCFAAVS